MDSLSRRQALQALLATSIASSPILGLQVSSQNKLGDQKLDKTDSGMYKSLSEVIYPDRVWTSEDLDLFLDTLPTEGLLRIKQGVGLLQPESSIADLKGRTDDIKDIKTQIVYMSSNTIAYYGWKSTAKVDYHAIVKWIAEKLEVSQWIVNGSTTFILEKAILSKCFHNMWDNLDLDQRKDLLDSLIKEAPGGKDLTDKVGDIAKLNAGKAFALIRITVKLVGFNFYKWMSIGISCIGKLLNIAIPFSVYRSASWLMGVLTGPIGWAITAINIALAVKVFTDPNVNKAAAVILQIHCLKVAAMDSASSEPPSLPLLRKPKLIHPLDATIIVPSKIDFNWSPVPGAKSYELLFQDADNVNYICEVDGSKTTFTYSTPWVRAGNITWKCRAFNSDCGYSPWSEGKLKTEETK